MKNYKIVFIFYFCISFIFCNNLYGETNKLINKNTNNKKESTIIMNDERNELIDEMEKIQ